MKINSYDVTKSEDVEGRFVADASDLGLRLGAWPRQIQTTIGNGLPFVLHHELVRSGALVAMVYYQTAGGASLVIYNN